MPKAKEIMTPHPVTCLENDTVFEAANIMEREDTGVVPVVDDQNRCSGVITDRDICLRVVVDNKDPKTTPLYQVMSENLLTCKPDDDLNQILNQMERKQVKRILVVDEDKRCVGIISEADIAQKVPDPAKVGELAEGVYS